MAISFRSWIESLPPPVQRLMHQPVWWASVASVGVHGIIFILLPFMSLPKAESREPDLQRQVSIIELGPQELSRVPDFSTPDIDLPPIPDGSDFYSFEGFDDSDDPDDLLKPDPVPLPSAPLRFPFPPPPAIQWPIVRRPTIPSPQPQTPPTPPPTPSPDTPPPENTNETNPSPDDSNASETDAPNEDTNPTASEGNSGNPDEQAPETAEQRNERLIAQQLAEQEELQRRFTYNEELRNAAGRAFEAWKDQAEQANISAGGVAETVIRLPYPGVACPIGQDVTVWIGAFVDEGNKVIETPAPVVISSSGFEYFDQKALEAIATHNFNNETGVGQAYSIEVVFDHSEEACGPSNPATAPSSQDSPNASESGHESNG